MKCPFCGKETVKGKLRTRGDNYFIPEGCKTNLIYTHKSMENAGAVLVSPKVSDAIYERNWQTAFKCDNCRKLIVEY